MMRCWRREAERAAVKAAFSCSGQGHEPPRAPRPPPATSRPIFCRLPCGDKGANPITNKRKRPSTWKTLTRVVLPSVASSSCAEGEGRGTYIGGGGGAGVGMSKSGGYTSGPKECATDAPA
eukprot:scaffold2664_cov117-Isochrysis_galbana.AAC.8